MLNVCNGCGSDKEIIHFNKTKDKVITPVGFCNVCVTKAIMELAPGTFPRNIRPDVGIVRSIVNADKQAYDKIYTKLVTSAQKSGKVAAPGVEAANNSESASPKKIFEYLDQYIMGQDDAKKKLALAIRRKQMADTNGEINKINLLLVGPTASGKTELCRVASNFLKTPFIKVDCSHLTPSGYRGVNVDTILIRLFDAAGGNLQKAENGIVFLDELDKLVNSSTEFFSRVQQELLKIIEGGDIMVEVERGRQVTINTQKILFIGAGAFVGMEKIVNPKKTNIKLAGEVEVAPKQEVVSTTEIAPKHLIQYGLIPELVGRFTHTAKLSKLTSDDLFKILTHKKNSLKAEYESIFLMMDKHVTFSDEFMREVADKAAKSETGARNLRTIMEEELKEYLFNETEIPERFTGKRKLELAA